MPDNNNNKPMAPSLLDTCKGIVEFLTEAQKAGEVHWNTDVVPILEEKLRGFRAAIKKAEGSKKVENFECPAQGLCDCDEHRVFMVSGENLKKLSSGAMKTEEAAKLENIAVVAWAGADIMNMLKEDSEFMCGRQTMPQDLDVEALITDVANDSSFHQWIIEEVYDRVHTALDEIERQQASEPDKEVKP